jgi:hypothetical protein
MSRVQTRHPPSAGRRPLGNAEGVLIALRRCSADDAFAELVAAARRHCVPVFTLASALVDLAAGQCPDPDREAADRAARDEWAGLLRRQLAR